MPAGRNTGYNHSLIGRLKFVNLTGPWATPRTGLDTEISPESGVGGVYALLLGDHIPALGRGLFY